MKLINNFATKSSLTGRWVGISAENWRISGEIVTKNIKCCRQTGNRGGHFVFWDIEPEMLGHNPAEVPGHRPVILLLAILPKLCHLAKTWPFCQDLANLPRLGHFAKTWPFCQDLAILPRLGHSAKTWPFCQNLAIMPRLGHFAKTWPLCQDLVIMPRLGHFAKTLPFSQDLAIMPRLGHFAKT